MLLMDKSTISMAIFNRFLYVDQRVSRMLSLLMTIAPYGSDSRREALGALAEDGLAMYLGAWEFLDTTSH